MKNQSTICAIATPAGNGAISIIRLSGKDAIKVCNKAFKPVDKSKELTKTKANTIVFGTIIENSQIIDEVLVSVFKAPHSYTGEDIVEVSCHGSQYIQSRILQLFIRSGASLASPGEFTMRAFLNGKLDLSQAEAVADLIASNSKTAHKLAIKQMRGGFSEKIKDLREQLINFASLIELELDFSEEDVEFAKRTDLLELLSKIDKEISILINSFSLGNVMKNGIPVAIIGKPNVGKSTLLNLLLNEERAIVSELPGTTRDAIEDTMVIDGTAFRFIDTAGLRESTDQIENIGIEKTYEKINLASVILYLFDISQTNIEEINSTIQDFKIHLNDPSKRIIVIANMIDKLVEIPKHFKDFVDLETIFISAKRNENIHLITESLIKSVANENISENTIISNARHYEALTKTKESLIRATEGIHTNIPSDLVAQDIREALHYLGEITGQITSNDILHNIFAKFCIGK